MTSLKRAKEIADNPAGASRAEQRKALNRLLNVGWFNSADKLAKYIDAQRAAAKEQSR